MTKLADRAFETVYSNMQSGEFRGRRTTRNASSGARLAAMQGWADRVSPVTEPSVNVAV